MLNDFDYRFCTKASLQVMQIGRQKIYEDMLNREYIIYRGLHELDAKRRLLYFQYYIVIWLEEHWGNMQKILAGHPEYSVDQRKQITLFWAKYYGKMIDDWQVSGVLSKMILPDLLKAQKEGIEELIRFSEEWESRSNKLKLLLAKHKEQFEVLIRRYEKE